MATEVIHVGQNKSKDCIVGDRLMNRYSVFNGLDKPLRIDSNSVVTQLDSGTPTIISVTSVVTAGNLADAKYYAYKAMYGSTKYTRPVAVLDATSNSTRGRPSTVSSALSASALSSMSVVIQGGAVNAGITQVFLYRSLNASTAALAEAGPFYYVGLVNISSANMTITDSVADSAVGIAIETDNYPPNAYRYAVSAFSRIFAGGNLPIGADFTITLTTGSSTVTASGDAFFNGIIGWTFKADGDTSGGVDDGGIYYANYSSATELELVNALGASINYDGDYNGAGYSFRVFLPGYALRWSKIGEPESYPLANTISFEGDITGIAPLPNSSLLIVCTDTPSMWALDLTLVGTSSFSATKRIISTEYSVTSHYSFIPVVGRLRGIDAGSKCIIETDGVRVSDVSSGSIPAVFNYLSGTSSYIKNWHCAYDKNTDLFGAFVALKGSHRIVNFCIGQNMNTGGWFFNLEKDLLCTGSYTDPATGEIMTLGGTQGLPGNGGAVWGRIWAPNVYSDWFPGGLRSGNVASSTATVLTVDNSGEDLYTTSGGLAGRWILVVDEDGESPQLAYIKSNTANEVTVDSVINTISTTSFNPVPDSTYKFYIGLIEMRWGPKYFDFNDPDNNKKIIEVIANMKNYNGSDLPFFRFYRGLEIGYNVHRDVVEGEYRQGDNHDANNVLTARYKHSGEESPRWGMAVVDRSYDSTELLSVSIVFNRIGGKDERD